MTASIAPVSEVLLQPLFLDDLFRLVAGFEHDLEHLLGELDRRACHRQPVRAILRPAPVRTGDDSQIRHQPD